MESKELDKNDIQPSETSGYISEPEMAKRLNLVVTMLLRGARRQQIIETVNATTATKQGLIPLDWGLSIRHIDNYIQSAKVIIRKQTEDFRKDLVTTIIAELRDTYASLRAEGKHHSAGLIDIAILENLEGKATQKIKVEHTNQQPITVITNIVNGVERRIDLRIDAPRQVLPEPEQQEPAQPVDRRKLKRPNPDDIEGKWYYPVE